MESIIDRHGLSNKAHHWKQSKKAGAELYEYFTLESVLTVVH